MDLRHNIDKVRTEIMRLENAKVFDAEAWKLVLADLSADGNEYALVDAQRRMETAKLYQSAPTVGGMVVRTDLGIPGQEIELTLLPVAVETVVEK